jgi:putative ABC transport system substrate-binding protein
MRRREFLTALLAAAAPAGARAQGTRLPVVGILLLGDPDPGSFMTAFRQGLREAGYTEGQDIRLELRSAGGRAANLPQLAAELVGLKADIIVAWQTPAALAAKRATQDVPVVMAGVGDPLATGLVTSLARPGGNLTGTSSSVTDYGAKILSIVRETLPSVRRVAILAHATDPFTIPYLAQFESAAPRQGVEIDPVRVQPAEPLEGTIEAMRQKGAEAVIVQGSMHRPEVPGLMLKHRLPVFSNLRQLPATGGLLSYGGIGADTWRQAASYVDRILRGALPGDLPVAQPTRFELVVNLKTAQALGLSLPPSIIARADEVIE